MPVKGTEYLKETEYDLIRGCMAGDRQSQSRLYALFAPSMMGVCMRYARSKEEAEEVLQEGFVKVFTCIHQYKGEGPFGGWVRKIMVNCSLQRIRSQMRQTPVVSLSDYTASREPVVGDSAESHLSAKELMKLVMLLPPAYKMIFNLYVFEGYKHGEIASMLGISEGTSKSNLSDARAYLQKLLKKNKIVAR